MRRGILPVCILVLACISCGAGTTGGIPASPVPQTPLATQAVPTQPPTPTPQGHFAVGQTGVQAANWLVTVSAVTTSEGSAYIKPRAGDRFLVVTVSLKNTDARMQILSSLLQFILRDANGYKYNETYLDTARPAPDGQVEAGALVSGDLVYEVPTAMHRFVFIFEPNVFLRAQAIWDVAV